MNMNMSKLQDSGEEESGMLQCTGLQKVRHDIVTKQQQQINRMEAQVDKIQEIFNKDRE